MLTIARRSINTLNMIKLKLYGQPTSTYEYAKMRVLEEVEKAGVKYELLEVNDVNEFINEGIKSVPTFKVNGNLEINYRKNTDLDEFVRSTVENILKHEDYGTMAKIIVPIDFSKSSENALRYAYEMAVAQNKVIKLLHAYHPMSIDIDGVSIIDPHVENIKRKQLKQLSFKKKQLEALGPKVPYVDEEFRVGFAVEEIVDLSDDDSTDMIVMGSTGRGSAIKKWFGSVSLEVMKKAKAPVLIVPPSAEYKGISNVLYATDNPMVDTVVLEALAELMKPFHIKLHLVHVNDQKNSPSEHANILKLLGSFYSPDQMAYNEIAGHDVASTIDNYAKEHQIDMIVMTRKKRTLLDSLLKPSVTSKMAIHATLPLLVFHEGGKVCRCGGACKKKAKDSDVC